MTKKNGTFWGILGTIIFCFILLLGFSIYTIKLFKSTYDEENIGGSSKDDRIAVIEIKNVIWESKVIVNLLHKAEKSKKIKGIIVRINSPGGAVAPSQEIYSEIRRIDTADPKKNGKPIYASLSTVATSGGYYIASATRKIFANKGTITGSIGVVMQFMNLSKLYELIKISFLTLKAGKYKDIGATNRKMTSEEKKLLNEMLEHVHKQFIHDILETRKDKIVGDIEDLAEGQIFSGEKAYEHGLVDQVGTLWDAGRALSSMLGHKESLELYVLKKHRTKGLWKIFKNFSKMFNFINDMTNKAENSDFTLMYR